MPESVHGVKPLKLNNNINCLCKYLKTCYRNGRRLIYHYDGDDYTPWHRMLSIPFPSLRLNSSSRPLFTQLTVTERWRVAADANQIWKAIHRARKLETRKFARGRCCVTHMRPKYPQSNEFRRKKIGSKNEKWFQWNQCQLTRREGGKRWIGLLSKNNWSFVYHYWNRLRCACVHT